MGVFTLTIVRHGETQANKDRVIQGHQDTPLSEVGLEQARLAGLWLQQEQYTHAISSDLQRAHKTCELILEKNLSSSCSIVKDPRIRERKFGAFEGRPSVEFQAASRKHRKSSSQTEEFPPGGETVKQLKARAREFFRDLCQKLTEQSTDTPVITGVAKRRRQTTSTGSEVFSSVDGATVTTDADNNSAIMHLNIDDSEATTTSMTSSKERKPSVNSAKDSGHSSSGSTSSTTSGCENLPLSSQEQLLEKRKSPVGKSQTASTVFSIEPTSDISPSQESSCSSLDESPSEPAICMSYDDQDIHSSLTASSSVQYGCPNVSLSPIFEHRLSSMSSISSGRNSSFDDGDAIPATMAEVLIVSHGGWIQQLITLFVDELGCKIPGGKKYALQVSPNTGHSKFTVSMEPNMERPTVTCLYIHDKDHLNSHEYSQLQDHDDA